MSRVRTFLMVVVFPTASVFLVSCGSGNGPELNASEIMAGGDTGPCPTNIQWARYDALASLNRAVLNFSANSIGHGFPPGECTDFVSAALAGAHARGFSDPRHDGNYVWGNLITTVTSASASLASVRPGDIIQMRNVSFRWTVPNGWRSSTFGHHTAVVSAIAADGHSLCIYQQNAPIGSKVNQSYYPVYGMQDGTMWIYRPSR